MRIIIPLFPIYGTRYQICSDEFYRAWWVKCVVLHCARGHQNGFDLKARHGWLQFSKGKLTEQTWPRERSHG